MAQLTGWSFPIPEVRGLKPGGRRTNFMMNIFDFEMTKLKKTDRGMTILKRGKLKRSHEWKYS